MKYLILSIFVLSILICYFSDHAPYDLQEEQFRYHPDYLAEQNDIERNMPDSLDTITYTLQVK